jgi:threonine efflux protein
VLVPLDAPPWFGFGLLAAIIATTAGWYTLVAITMSSDAIVARGYRRAERGMNAVTGALFVAVGARLAVAQ